MNNPYSGHPAKIIAKALLTAIIYGVAAQLIKRLWK